MLGFFSTAAVNREVVFKVELGVVVVCFFLNVKLLKQRFPGVKIDFSKSILTAKQCYHPAADSDSQGHVYLEASLD